MKEREHNGAIIAGATDAEIDRFIANDDKIKAGQCPNGCGKLYARDYGQHCEYCGFDCNTPRSIHANANS